MKATDFDKLVAATRSVRRFAGDKEISIETLRELVSLARLSPSGRNMQPLKYILVTSSTKRAELYDHLAWAGALKEWDGPSEPERPAGYIVILGDKRISNNFGVDHGIAAQTMMLGAKSRGLGCCMVGSIKRKKLQISWNIENYFEILLVLALGEPVENIVVESLEESESYNYWRDENQTHHVPKRDITDLIMKEL